MGVGREESKGGAKKREENPIENYILSPKKYVKKVHPESRDFHFSY